MIYSGGQRNSTSPYIKQIWHARMSGQGQIMLPAKSNWDFMVVRSKKSTSAILAGPRSQALPMVYNEDSEYIGLEFVVGVYFQDLQTPLMVNSSGFLPPASKNSFWLAHSRLEFPTYQNIETFVEILARRGLLLHDSLVRQHIHGWQHGASPRTVQRHFLQATGLSFKRFQQIARAKHAVDLLQAGAPAARAAYEVGYSDQFHLSRSLRLLTGQTPTQIQSYYV